MDGDGVFVGVEGVGPEGEGVGGGEVAVGVADAAEAEESFEDVPDAALAGLVEIPEAAHVFGPLIAAEAEFDVGGGDGEEGAGVAAGDDLKELGAEGGEGGVGVGLVHGREAVVLGAARGGEGEQQQGAPREGHGGQFPLLRRR